MIEFPINFSSLLGKFNQLAASTDAHQDAPALQALVEGTQGLFGIAGMGGADHQRFRSACPGRQTVIAMHEYRNR